MQAVGHILMVDLVLSKAVAVYVVVLVSSTNMLACMQAVGHILMDGLVSSLGVAAGGLLALPILASDTLQAEAADVLTRLGHSLSRSVWN